MFIKPARLGSSIGISKAYNLKELAAGVEKAFLYDTKLLIEEGIESPREFAIGVMGRKDKIETGVIGEFQSFKKEFFDYEAKYGTGSLDGIVPAQIDIELEKKLKEMALLTFKYLELTGFARVDCFYDGKEIYMNEVNTIPGLETHGTFTKTWAAAGLSRTEFIDRVIEIAIEEYEEKQKLQTDILLTE